MRGFFFDDTLASRGSLMAREARSEGGSVTSQRVDALKQYARAIRETLRSGPTNIEQALAPSFKT